MKISEEQRDALQEFLNIGVGRAAASLNQIVSSHVTLRVPEISIIQSSDLRGRLPGFSEYVKAMIELEFRGPFTGTAALLFPLDSAVKLVDTLTGTQSADGLDEIGRGTITEVGNIVVNGVLGTMGNLIEEHLIFSVPRYLEGTIETAVSNRIGTSDKQVLLAKSTFEIEEQETKGDIILIFEGDSFQALIKSIDIQMVA